MRRIFFCVMILLVVVSVVALGQATRYTFVKNFPNDTYRTPGTVGGHGVAVDPEGKVWFQPYDVADSVLVASTGKYAKTRVVMCWKPDGTPASFSPIKIVTVGTATDTLWNSSRGMRADANGNIVFTSFDTYYRLNYKTGAGMSKIVANFNNTGIQPAFDSFNEMFTGLVIPKGPIKIHDNAGAFLGNVRDSADGFARSIEVSADGNDVFWAGYTNNAVYKYHSDNGSLGPYNKVDTVMVGLSVESITRHPKTGAYWASGGSAGSVDRGYRNYKWYAFAPTNLNTPIDSLSWAGSVAADPRPRGMAFSPSGDTVYVCEFGTNTVGPIQMFVKKAATQVTFWANTSTVPDTMKAKSFVQIRGSVDAFGPWGPSSPAVLQNVAGDYWRGTVSLKPGDTIQYKFFTNAKTALTSASEHQGWEKGFTTDASGNRILIVPKADTVLPLQFVNGTPVNQPQFFTPYVNQKDSIEIWFRVNMSGQESFNKATQYMGVRGGFAGSDYKDWAKSIVLTREDQHGDGGSRQYDGTNFWSGYVRVPKSTFTSNIEYKFVILKTPSPTSDVTSWEDGIRPAPDAPGNRVIFASPGISDTTLYWKWWANVPVIPFVGKDTVVVTFRTNLSRAVAERGFSFGDTVQVRTGYGGTASALRTLALTRSGLTGTIFTGTDTVLSAVGKPLNYQYYLVKGGNDVREVFYDFDDATGGSQAERRKITLASKAITVNDTTTTSFDLRRMPRFRNTAKLSKNVAVTYTVDVRPAYYTVKAGKKLVATNISSYVIGNADSVMKWGVWMNGPAVGGWDVRGGWGAARRADTVSQMYDDGTHGDLVKGDSVYSLRYNYTTADFLGQEFKFGVGGFDNEGGFGNNHIENVDDAASTYTLASQFGSIDPKFFNSWDFDLKKPKLATAIEDDWSGVPLVYNLDQNYPNPFNPSTTIRFTLGAQEIVRLKIFNTLGQEVMTLLDGKVGAGVHTVRFDAARLTSGVYFYQIIAGKFVETKKMILMK